MSKNIRRNLPERGNMDIRVSVIVPIYNAEKYLRRCLDSLVGQTLPGVQIVAVDDGSTDSSAAILQEYVEKYPERFVTMRQENAGQAVARNRAIPLCTGEYTGFMDADDYAKPDMFEKLYTAATACYADYASCGYTDFCTKDGVEKLDKEVIPPPCKDNKDLYIDTYVVPLMHLFRTDLLQESGVLFPEGLIYEDTAFYINMIPHLGKVTYVNESLACRMRHANSTMTNISPSRVRNIFGVMDSVENYYKNNRLLTDTYKDYKEYTCTRILLGSSMDRISKVDDAAERKALINETFDYLEKVYPNYLNNRILKSDCSNKNKILRLLRRSNCIVYVWILRIKNMIKGQYE